MNLDSLMRNFPIFIKRYIKLFCAVVMLYLFGIIQPAEGARPSPDTTGKLKVSFSLEAGDELDKTKIGKTTTGEDVTIGAGGGAGLLLNVDYGLSEKLDIGLSAGFMESELKPPLSNAEGSFERNILLITLKHNIPFLDFWQLNVGGGLGVYWSGQLDIDLTGAGLEHLVADYDDAIGFHVVAEWDTFFMEHWSLTLGLKYYGVEYVIDSAKINGASVPVSIFKRIDKLDGSGVDVILSIGRYF